MTNVSHLTQTARRPSLVKALLLVVLVLAVLVTIQAVKPAPDPVLVIACGENAVPCPPEHHGSVLARFGETWHVAGFGRRSGWVTSSGVRLSDWPDEWVELQ